jgi:arginyl-tRNA synthetase
MNPRTALAATQFDDALRGFGDAAASLVAAQYSLESPPVAFESPRRPEFGDFATNLAF